MENVSSALPHVPFMVPIPGMTFEEYLHYLSWRIHFQILATTWQDWKQSTSSGEREWLQGRILKQLMVINDKAACFPVQLLPDDISTIVIDLTDQNVRPGMLPMAKLLQGLAQVFA